MKLYCLFIFVGISCSSNKAGTGKDLLEIPLFPSKAVESGMLYLSHGIANDRMPTLIEIKPNASRSRNGEVILIEEENVKINGIETINSKSFIFPMSYSHFPNGDLKELNLDLVPKSKISSDAYFLIIPNYPFRILLDHSNIHTKTGERVLKWLKINIAKISIYEAINIWQLEKNRKISDEELKGLREQSYKLDEKIHLKW